MSSSTARRTRSSGRLARSLALAGAALLLPALAACSSGTSSEASTSTPAEATSAASQAPASEAPASEAASVLPAGGPIQCALTEKTELAPFEFSDTVGEVPDLPKAIAWANTSDAEFFMQITRSIEQAAKDRGIEFITAIADDDSAKNIEQMETFLQRGIGALAVQPLDANAQAPLMQRAIDSGAAVMSLVTPPSTNQAIADQYKVGNTQGLAAAKYITEKLGGKAKVVYFNTDSIEVLKARHQGAIDGVMTAGDGVEIVADVQPEAITQDAGFQAMSTILQKNPDVDVVIGGDTYVLGALAALEAEGKARDDMYLSGIDGDEQALAAVEKGGPYKASFAFAYPLMGYAWGQFAADWLEGKSIPQVMQLDAIELSSKESIDAFKKAMSDPAATWKNSADYLTMLGNVSYGTRDQCITYAA
jgi:ribose transport system substrate-binding protein